MKAIRVKAFLALLIIALFYPSSLSAAAPQRIALVIGNSAYSSGPLKNPVNDASAIAAILKKLEFSVTFKNNVGHQDMDEAIREFGRQLKKTRGVGLFYYAGHGVQIGGINYLLPVNARLEKESDARFQAINVDFVLAEMEYAENGLNIVILDACRDNPFSRNFRNAARGLAIISSAPSGTFISYATGANQAARDGEGKNSHYTKALLENISKPGLTINQVFMNVRSTVKKETGQVPWELSSLEGDFYFVPGSGEKVASRVESSVSVQSSIDDMGEVHRKLQVLAKRLEEDKADLERKRVLEEKLKKIEKEMERLTAQQEVERQAAEERNREKKTTTLAMGKRPSTPMSDELRRDGRFTAYGNGTVLDTKTNLMWAAKDNGANINWEDAKSYCEKYRGGGYTDWRMPTQDELRRLYDTSKSRPVACYSKGNIHVATELIDLTCTTLWASETGISWGAPYARVARTTDFYNGLHQDRTSLKDEYNCRVLPVRSAK